MILTKDQINIAVEKLQVGEAVALPTETVYGLAARIDSPDSIKQIFSLKNRPFFDPLIVHISQLSMAEACSKSLTDSFKVLADKFWPGPLTMIVEKSEKVDDMITSGLPTVGLRMPKHNLFLQVIDQLGVPLAAPSANQFGKTSPTTAEHVNSEFSEDLCVLDGGSCDVGLESTIIELVEEEKNITIKLLRPGVLSVKEIKAELESKGFSVQVVEVDSGATAPGQMENHYQPEVPVVLLKEGSLEDVCKQLSVQQEAARELKLGSDPVLFARQLYSQLRELSKENGLIYINVLDEHNDDSWEAIFNRLRRAASLTL